MKDEKPTLIEKQSEDFKIRIVYSNKEREMTKGVFHYRCFRDGKLLSRGGVTIAWECDGDKVVFGMALCSPLDVYVKRLGRMKAQGYLRSRQAELESRRGWMSGQGWDIIEHVDKRKELLSEACPLWHNNLKPPPFDFLFSFDVREWLRLKPWRWELR